MPNDAAAVRVFPPLVPLATVLTGVGLDRLWPLDIGHAESAPSMAIAGAVIVVVGVLIALLAIVTLQRAGQDPNPSTPTPSIIDRGPFRFSRNPIYLAMVLFCLGFAIRRSNVWLLLLTPVAMWVLHAFVIVHEERYLERKFGDIYRAYQQRVRRWL